MTNEMNNTPQPITSQSMEAVKMKKFEYLRMFTADTSTLGNKSRTYIIPSYKIDSIDFLQNFPTLKIEIDKSFPNALIYVNDGKEPGIFFRVMDYLGNQGWEPFAIVDNLYHFKRES
jgi:hypothetical protein